MNLRIFLNELSTLEYANNRFDARENMRLFILTYNSAVDLGFENMLRTETIFFETILTKGYTVCNWLDDSNVNRDLRTMMITIGTHSPFFEKSESGKYLEFGYELNGKTALGLGFTYRLRGLAISFLTSTQWNENEIKITQIHYEDNNTEEVIVKHASQPHHVSELKDWITERKLEAITDGEILWRRRGDIFPFLVFCESVFRQIKDITARDFHWNNIMNKLRKLNNYCSNPEKYHRDLRNIIPDVRQESNATLEKYKGSRTFTCPDGKDRVFKWHTSIPPDVMRLHYFNDAENGTIIIGYIGKHLPIVSNPT
ncbi:MAG: hypothetical protein HQ568_01495 [Calditrichaeota bacterium]|nr:hypothetical protein [Calditrichota bacterium]